MATPKRYLVTAALPYANGLSHFGHLAGNFLPADIYVRFLRLMGKDVVWVCGSDEHGASIDIRAKKEGLTPKQIVDKYHHLNKESFDALGLSFDMYHRTSLPIHHQTTQDFFLHLNEKGDEFEVRESEQYYDEDFKQFLADQFIKGDCPKCGHADAYGNQCENCGSALSPTELVNPVSTLSGKKPVLKRTKHWYFRLDKHADWLRDWVEKGELDGKQHHDPKTWRKHVTGQVLSWLNAEEGLQPRAITRDLDWGIDVPLPDAEGKVMYVWFDAPIGYISATKDWATEQGKDWKDYWQSEDCEMVHFIGKDNIVFHCIIFPAMLKAHGDYILPTNVPANQFLNFEGQKFSKSRGWGTGLKEYLETFKDFPNHVDALRYALTRNMPENKDSDFKWDEFTDYHDKELADNLGNFVNRVIVLTNKYYDGKIPAYTGDFGVAIAPVTALVEQLVQHLWSYKFKEAIQTLMEISSYGNTHLQDVSPWKLWKTEPENPVIHNCMRLGLEIVQVLSVLAKPFIPATSDKMRGLLNLPLAENGAWAQLLDTLKVGKTGLEDGHVIGAPSLLFAKIHDRKDKSRLELIEAEKAKLAAIIEAEKANERAPLKDEIQFDDFSKLDIRTGTITSAEKVKKADKLLKLTVDLGFETRTVVSGIAKHFSTEEVIGQQVLLLANLAPRKLRGVESQGMILMAEDEKGNLVFVQPKDAIGNGLGVS